MASGINNEVPRAAERYGKEVAGEGAKTADDLMQSIRDTADMQMRFQSEMGLIQLATKMNEAVAKTLKAAGDAIKGLAG